MELPMHSDAGHPWQWEESRWRSTVDKVRARRSLKPDRWKDGARVAVALSFDSDHETLTLRSGDTSPGKLSQGQYGNRAGMPRILAMKCGVSTPLSTSCECCSGLSPKR